MSLICVCLFGHVFWVSCSIYVAKQTNSEGNKVLLEEQLQKVPFCNCFE